VSNGSVTYGVTPAGFVVKPLSECLSEIQAAVQATFGQNQQVADPAGPWGQLCGILADRESEIWDMAQEVYASRDPDQATGAGLQALAAITGTFAQEATASTVTCVLLGTVATVIPAGSSVSAGQNGAAFTSSAAATIAAATAWTGSTSFAVGAVTANTATVAGAAVTNLYVCAAETGPSAASGGPTGTGAGIVDGGVTWNWVAPGSACAVATFQAADTGPIEALAGTINTIVTPVAGWSAVVNPFDAVPGLDADTDASLRVRRVVELEVAGSATPDAIRARIMAVSGVTACTVFRNMTNAPNALGMPPYSVEALVTGGADADILTAAWNAVAAGTQTYGTTQGQVTDSEGVVQSVYFSRPTSQPIYVSVLLAIDNAAWPADGTVEVQTAIIEWAQANLSAGNDVVTRALFPAILSVPGVVDITHCYVGTTASPVPSSEANITIATTEIAEFQSTNITVTVAPFTP